MIIENVLQKGVIPLGPDGVPRASRGELFQDGLFGRDAITVALHELADNPEIARNTLLTLATYQGTKIDEITEEEIGKILHERRYLYHPNGSLVCEKSQQIFYELKPKWGNSPDTAEDEFTYYGSADATPSFLILLNEYIKIHGKSILNEVVQQKKGKNKEVKELTLKECAIAAADYIQNKVKESERKHKISLYGFYRLNTQGIPYQGWLDGNTSYHHTNGELANPNEFIYDTPMQGLAYDALNGMENILDPNDPRLTNYQACASNIQRETFARLWMEEEEYFAMGLDFDPQNPIQSRRIETLHANVGEILNSGIFDNLSSEKKRLYITGIVRKLMSNEFLTDAGIRTEALLYKDIFTLDEKIYTGYQSALTSWFKQTAEVALGFIRQRLPQLADQLFLRLINTIRIMNTKEFVYILADGRIGYNVRKILAEMEERVSETTIFATNIPEEGQAWTESTYNLALFHHAHPQVPVQEEWQRKLEETCLHKIINIKEYTLDAILTHRDSFPIDIYPLIGKKLEEELVSTRRSISA